MAQQTKRQIGYQVSGYVIEGKTTTTAASGSSSDSSGLSASGGLKTAGNVITDTWEIMCKIDRYGAIIVSDSGSKNLVQDKAHKTIVTTQDAANNGKARKQLGNELSNYDPSSTELVIGCSIPQHIIKEYCATLFPDSGFSSGDAFIRLSRAGKLAARIKVQTGVSTGFSYDVMVVNILNQGDGSTNSCGSVYVNGAIFTSSNYSNGGLTLNLMKGDKQITIGSENVLPVMSGKYDLNTGTMEGADYSNFINNGNWEVSTAGCFNDYSLLNTKYAAQGLSDCRIRFYIIGDASEVTKIANADPPPASDKNGDGIFSKGKNDNAYEQINAFSTSLDLPAGIDARVIRYICECLQLYETGKIVAASYGTAADIGDGAGMSYGKYQFTEHTKDRGDGTLKALLNKYYFPSTNSAISLKLKGFMSQYNKGAGWGKTASNYSEIKNTLIEAGNEPAMQKAQETAFNALYMKNAINFFNTHGCSYPVFLLLIADCTLNSGYGNVSKMWIKAFGSNNYQTSPEKEIEDFKKCAMARKDWLSKYPANQQRPQSYYDMAVAGNVNLDKDWYFPKKGWTVLAQQEGGYKGKLSS